MAKFFVGQRVRIVYVRHNPALLGSETRIVGINQDFISTLDGQTYRGYLKLDVTLNGVPAFAHPDSVEPILPEGHRPAELSVEELLPFLKTREAA